jgi:hypothetical protein
MLSIAAPASSSVLDTSDAHSVAVDVGPIAVGVEPAHVPLTTVAENAADDTTKGGRPTDDGVASLLAGGEQGTILAGAIKRPGSASSQARAVEELVSVKPRNLDPELTTTTPTDDSARTVPGAYPSDDAGAAEHDSVAALTSSVTSAVLQGASTLPSPFNQTIGLDGRPGPGADASAGASLPAGAIAADAASSEFFALAIGTGQSPAASGSERARLLLWEGDVAPEPPTRTWGDVLQGALHADWDAVDRDLRRVLSRLANLSDPLDPRDQVAAWPLWMGVATALIAVQRASRGRRRWLLRSIGTVAPAPPDHAVPDAPWPLGPP